MRGVKASHFIYIYLLCVMFDVKDISMEVVSGCVGLCDMMCLYWE